jgi:D-glycero-alpha-D-manno-heptose-7-phosphate kinase
MIITKSPLRIGFAGGGSDLPAFCSENSGACINAAINKYVYVLVRKRYDDMIYLKYSENEVVRYVDEIQHDFIREALLFCDIDFGIEIINWADIPTKGTGLGSSSSFLVGLLNALWTLKGHTYNKHELAEQACEIEINRCKKNIGYQDQFIAAYGGLKFMQFYKNPEDTYVTSLAYEDAELDRLSRNIMAFYTGITRDANDILTEQSEDLKTDSNAIELMKANVDIANRSYVKLQNHIHPSLGHAMAENWNIKKKFKGITNPEIDKLVDGCMKAGAVGCKITGAGGGGFLIAYVHSGNQENIREGMQRYHPEVKEMPIKIDKYGTRVLMNVEQYLW